jgi:hypothetical protein
VDAGVELGHEDLDLVAQLRLELIDGADVVAMAVGERDPAGASAAAMSASPVLGIVVSTSVNPSSSRTR